MQKEGLEPSWYHYHTDLNRARLPIPPFLRTRCIIQYLIQIVNTIFYKSDVAMQKDGLEPSWYHYHTDLNRARLPIPPFLRTSVYYTTLHQMSTLFFKLFQMYIK